MNLEEIAHSILAKLPAEMAHDIAIQAMKYGIATPGKYKSKEPVKFLDVKLDSRIGIAAGFDKYALIQDRVRDYGFAIIEEGSFTCEGGEGNDGVRLLRVDKNIAKGMYDGCLWNRKGLNCIPAYVAAKRLERSDQNAFAVNIAKTNNDEIMGEDGLKDIINSYKSLKRLGIYTVINVSCPNTEEGKTFEEDLVLLKELFQELYKIKNGSSLSRPLGVKFSPNLANLREKMEAIGEYVDFYEGVNTEKIALAKYGKGGVSGPILREAAEEFIKIVRSLTAKPIISVGGISNGLDIVRREDLGANLFLCYNGFVYKHEKNPWSGVRFAHLINADYNIHRELADLRANQNLYKS